MWARCPASRQGQGRCDSPHPRQPDHPLARTCAARVQASIAGEPFAPKEEATTARACVQPAVMALKEGRAAGGNANQRRNVPLPPPWRGRLRPAEPVALAAPQSQNASQRSEVPHGTTAGPAGSRQPAASRASGPSRAAGQRRKPTQRGATAGPVVSQQPAALREGKRAAPKAPAGAAEGPTFTWPRGRTQPAEEPRPFEEPRLSEEPTHSEEARQFRATSNQGILKNQCCLKTVFCACGWPCISSIRARPAVE